MANVGWQLNNVVRKTRLLTNTRQLLNFCLKVQVQNKTGKSPRLKRGDTIFACGYHERVILTDYEIQMIHKQQICNLKELYQDPVVRKAVFWIACLVAFPARFAAG